MKIWRLTTTSSPTADAGTEAPDRIDVPYANTRVNEGHQIYIFIELKNTVTGALTEDKRRKNKSYLLYTQV